MILWYTSNDIQTAYRYFHSLSVLYRQPIGTLIRLPSYSYKWYDRCMCKYKYIQVSAYTCTYMCVCVPTYTWLLQRQPISSITNRSETRSVNRGGKMGNLNTTPEISDWFWSQLSISKREWDHQNQHGWGHPNLGGRNFLKPKLLRKCILQESLLSDIIRNSDGLPQTRHSDSLSAYLFTSRRCWQPTNKYMDILMYIPVIIIGWPAIIMAGSGGGLTMLWLEDPFTLLHRAACCSVLQRVAVCCSVLQCVHGGVAVLLQCCCMRRGRLHLAALLQCVAVWCGFCNTASCCSVLQYAAAWDLKFKEP